MGIISLGIQSVDAVDAAYESMFRQRYGLGLSQVGDPCSLRLWYRHNGYDQIPPSGRVLRLFRLGEVVEDQTAIDLMTAGYMVSDRQKTVKITQGETTLSGHIDGVVTGLLESGEPHLWECKTMNLKSFEKLLSSGYEAYSMQYKAQIHAYMLGLKLKRAYVTVYCKNDSRLYAERVPRNTPWITDLLQDVFSVIDREIPPSGICRSAEEYYSRFCDFRHECFPGGVS